jgi:NADPH:quinone reductase-like Zn-dependent oxidoreductase
MKAVVYSQYGPPDVLQLKEVEKPVPKDDEVLIKVRAVSLNASDWEILRGKPLYARIYGLVKPKYNILGSDVAGRVEAVGRNVKRFRIGDEVFGDISGNFGGFAEYVSAPEMKLMLKPAGVTLEQAATLPQAACIALQGLRDKGQIRPGQKVLINGAGGGAGSYAIQLAKYFGAEVTGVDNAGKLDMMRSLGAASVVDYRQEDFTRKGHRYDLILDLAAHHSMFNYQRALCPGGRYIMVGGSMKRLFQLLLLGPLISAVHGRRMGLLALKINVGLDFITDLVKTGAIAPVIDTQYPLSRVAEALQYLGEGRAKGKIVVTPEK